MKKKYLLHHIEQNQASNDRRFKKLRANQIANERINIVKNNMSWNNLTMMIAKYSVGENTDVLISDFKTSAHLMHESWVGDTWKLKMGRPKKVYDQFIFSAYEEMLWMLSLGVLLNIEKDEIEKLVEVIERSNVSDKLLNYFIKHLFPEYSVTQYESYKDYFDVPNSFHKVREAIDAPNLQAAASSLHVFLEKDWMRIHKESGWYDSHKRTNGLYFGYWSFETAAVVKITGLDDSSFRDHPYYPTDLVHGSTGQPKKKGFFG